MLDAKELRLQIKQHMGTVFEKNGFKSKNNGKRSIIWEKMIDDGEFFVGIAFSMDTRDSHNPEFRMELRFDPEDIRDIRSYSYAGWPPKGIRKGLGIKVSILDRVLSGGYDAWIPFPRNLAASPATWEDYARFLVEDLEKRIPTGKRVTKKTHRWEYDWETNTAKKTNSKDKPHDDNV